MTRRTLAAVALAAAMCTPTALMAEVPELIGFHGYLTDMSGNSIDAEEGLKFQIGLFHESTGGMPFWTDTYEGVMVQKGVFFVLLGSGDNPLPTLELDGTIKYLGIQINDSPELEPRMQLVSVPYAMRSGTAANAIFAQDAGKLGGVSADDFLKWDDFSEYEAEITTLKNQIELLQGKVEALTDLVKNPGCVDDCAKGEKGCSEDMGSLWTCGEADDGDPCLEQLAEPCPGNLKCAAGACSCVEGYANVCLGDDAHEQDSCGKPGKLIAACGEGLCSQGACVKWHRETPLQVAGINAMFTIGGHLYAVGKGGAAMHYDGVEWTRMATPTTLDLYGLWGHQNGGTIELYAVGQNGKVIHYKNGEWKTVITGIFHTLRGIYGISGSSLVAVGDSGTVLRYDGTKPAGFQWVTEAWGEEATWKDVGFRGVYAVNASKIWVAGTGGTILQYDGDTWTLQETPVTADLEVVWGTGGLSVWAAGAEGTILSFVTEWKLAAPNPSTTATLRGIWGSNPEGVTKIFAVGDDTNVYQSDSIVWAKMDKPVQGLGGGAKIVGVWGDDAPHDGTWIVAEDGRAAYLSPEDKWVFPAVTRNVRALFSLAGGVENQWAMGSDCLALRFVDDQWLNVAISGGKCDGGSGSQDFNAIWGTDPSTIFAVGAGGMFKVWDGSAWIENPENLGPAGGQANNDIWGTSAMSYYVVRDDATWIWNGTVWQSTGGGGGVAGFGTSMQDFWVVDGTSGNVKHFDGSEWTQEQVSTKPLKDIWGQGGSLWAVGNGAGVFQHTGGSWVDRSVGGDALGNDQLTSVWISAAGTAYVSARQGYSYLYKGGTWSYELTNPATDHLIVRGLTDTEILLGGVKTIYRRK